MPQTQELQLIGNLEDLVAVLNQMLEVGWQEQVEFKQLPTHWLDSDKHRLLRTWKTPEGNEAGFEHGVNEFCRLNSIAIHTDMRAWITALNHLASDSFIDLPQVLFDWLERKK